MIGVFDSGHGGLTVLNALVQHFPRERFVYLGDHAHAPYGSRTPEEIVDLTRNAVKHLFEQGCRLVILACNTASAIALRYLQQTWLPSYDPNRRILGVIVPTIEAVTGTRWSETLPESNRRSIHCVGIFATPLTVNSGAYVKEITCRAPLFKVIQQPCPDLAPAIEASLPDSVLGAHVQKAVQSFLRAVGTQRLDSVLLGCTHYPLVARHFEAALPASVPILSQPTLVAQSLRLYLERHLHFKNSSDIGGSAVLLTTGHAPTVSTGASRFLGRPMSFQNIFDAGQTFVAIKEKPPYTG